MKTEAETVETPEAPEVIEQPQDQPTETPEETPAAEEPAAEEEPSGPLSRSEARAGVRESAREQLQRARGGEEEEEEESGTPTKDRHGRKHDPKTGKYLPDEEDEAAAVEAADQDTDEEGAASEAAPGASEKEPDAAAPKAAGERIRVEIDSEHPLASQGLDAIEVSDETQAKAVRALMNGTYHRRKEVETLKTANRELETKVAELQEKQVRREADDAAVEQWKQSPEYQEIRQKFFDIQETHGKEAAQDYWAAQQAKLKGIRDKEYQDRMTEVERERHERAATAWTQEAWSRVENLPEYIRGIPELRKWFDEELHAFDARIADGQFDHLQGDTPEETAENYHRAFAQLFGNRLRSEKSVVERAREAGVTNGAPADQKPEKEPAPATITEDDLEKRLEQERKKAVEEYRQQLAAKREETPPHPVPGNAGVPRTPSVSRDEPEPDMTGKSVSEIKRKAREGARRDAQKLRTSGRV